MIQLSFTFKIVKVLLSGNIVWTMPFKSHTINNITDGQDHATHLGILNVDWNFQNSNTTHHLPVTRVPPGTCHNILYKLDTGSDSDFALISSSERLSTDPKTFVVTEKNQCWWWSCLSWWSCFSWCFSCFSTLCTLWDSWCSYRAYPPSPRVAASAACTSMWCLWACTGSPFSSRFSYCCKKRKKTSNLSETIDQST